MLWFFHVNIDVNIFIVPHVYTEPWRRLSYLNKYLEHQYASTWSQKVK